MNLVLMSLMLCMQEMDMFIIQIKINDGFKYIAVKSNTINRREN